jgi:hypothetical protein
MHFAAKVLLLGAAITVWRITVWHSDSFSSQFSSILVVMISGLPGIVETTTRYLNAQM